MRIGLASDPVASLPAGGDAGSDLPASIRALPFALWNRLGIGAANTWLATRWCRAGQAPLPLSEALFPLNRARLYFAGYGQAGMVEAQWLVPHPRFEAFAHALSECVARMRPRIALLASKLFAGTPDGFSFDGKGIALALQLPHPASTAQRAFLEALAEIAIAHDGRPNLIKESTLDPHAVRRALGGFEAARMGPLGDLCPGRSHLEARFPLRCFQRLSLPNIATRPCHWHDNRNTRGSSTPVLSY